MDRPKLAIFKADEIESIRRLNGATGMATWQRIAGYVNYTINDQWHVSVRGEYFDDKDAYRTFTVAYLPTKSLELRGDLLFDRSNQNVILDRHGVTADGSQTSIGLEAIYKF